MFKMWCSLFAGMVIVWLIFASIVVNAYKTTHMASKGLCEYYDPNSYSYVWMKCK